MQVRESGRIPLQKIILLLILMIGGSPRFVQAQLNEGGLPYSFTHALSDTDSAQVILSPPDLSSIRTADERDPLPYRYAVNLTVDLDILSHGLWNKASDGSSIWKLEVYAEGAEALTLYFSRFKIPPGGKLFVYNPRRTRCLGAFTEKNNNPEASFATALIPGDRIILEYNALPGNFPIPEIHISEIAYAYRGVQEQQKNGRDFGGSGACQVNIHCSEGNSWQQQKKGVARLSVKKGGYSYWCSGSLVNNVRNDRKPYFLTADHCGMNTTAEDIDRWIFYFNYTSPTCLNPLAEPPFRAMTGARLIAHGGNGGGSGSDFFLALLKDPIPDTFDVFYNGWSRASEPSPDGVGIHHPEGDIQKISTYTTPLITSNWNGNPYLSHWKVFWAQTENGHGVTEGGSSGSPIFDHSGHIVGTLTGGDSRCGINYENLPDYYGKFSYSWDQNGTDSASILKVWLDPDNTGTLTLDGQTMTVGALQPGSPPVVFPNPFSDRLHLCFSDRKGVVTVGVYDLIGNCLFIKETVILHEEKLDLYLQGLNRGMYFLHVQDQSDRFVLKIMKL